MTWCLEKANCFDRLMLNELPVVLRPIWPKTAFLSACKKFSLQVSYTAVHLHFEKCYNNWDSLIDFLSALHLNALIWKFLFQRTFECVVSHKCICMHHWTEHSIIIVKGNTQLYISCCKPSVTLWKKPRFCTIVCWKNTHLNTSNYLRKQR